MTPSFRAVVGDVSPTFFEMSTVDKSESSVKVFFPVFLEAFFGFTGSTASGVSSSFPSRSFRGDFLFEVDVSSSVISDFFVLVERVGLGDFSGLSSVRSNSYGVLEESLLGFFFASPTSFVDILGDFARSPFSSSVVFLGDFPRSASFSSKVFVADVGLPRSLSSEDFLGDLDLSVSLAFKVFFGDLALSESFSSKVFFGDLALSTSLSPAVFLGELARSIDLTSGSSSVSLGDFVLSAVSFELFFVVLVTPSKSSAPPSFLDFDDSVVDSDSALSEVFFGDAARILLVALLEVTVTS